MNFDNVKTILDHALTEQNIPCSDIAVSVDGKIVYRYMNGTRDSQKSEAVRGDELYFLYSATKLMTCTAALQLYEKGEITLEDEVSKYIPEFKNLLVKRDSGLFPEQNPLTIKHLFTMTSGMNYDIKNEVIREQIERKPESTTLDLVRVMAQMPLEFEPGTHFKYSLSHDVLAAIIEIVSGMRFGEYLQKHIFDVCRMENTYVGVTEALRSRICSQYIYVSQTGCTELTKTENPFILTPNYESGGAGVVSCVEDYMRFANALVSGESLLKRTTVDLMRTEHISAAAYEDFQSVKKGYSYGLGVRTNTKDNFSAKGEFGWDGAAGAYVMLDPDNHLAVFYATYVRNRGNFLYDKLHPQLRDEVYRSLGLRT